MPPGKNQMAAVPLVSVAFAPTGIGEPRLISTV